MLSGILCVEDDAGRYQPLAAVSSQSEIDAFMLDYSSIYAPDNPHAAVSPRRFILWIRDTNGSYAIRIDQLDPVSDPDPYDVREIRSWFAN